MPIRGEADRLYSVEVKGDSHAIFGDQHFASLSINRQALSTSTYLQTSDPRQCCSDMPNGKLAVHIDLDYFVNDFNGNPGNAPRSLSRNDYNYVLKNMDIIDHFKFYLHEKNPLHLTVPCRRPAWRHIVML